MIAEPPAFPKALDDDEDDVAWALQTAAVQWERGGHADAVVWLRRAAQAAVEAGEFGRAADLERGARVVETWVERGAVGPAVDDDDGVDALLAGAPEIEAGELTGPSPSLVDVLEAEARDELGQRTAADFADVTEVGDLGDMEDVEDIEADDVVDLSEDVSFASEPPTQAISSSRNPKPVIPEDADEPTVGRGVRVAQPRFSSKPAKPARSLPPPRAEPVESLPLPREPLPSGAPVLGVEIEVDIPASSGPPPEDMPASVRLRSDPPFEATLVDVPRPEEPAPLSALLDAPLHESTLLDASRPDEGSEAPLSAGVLAAELGPDTAPAPSPNQPATAPSAAPDVVAVELLAGCRGLEDLPPETQAELAARASLERLSPDQEVSGFGLAIVAEGEVLVMPTIAEAACGLARRGEPVFSRGNLADGVALRVVALEKGAAVAVLKSEDFEHMLATCPWVAEELRTVADRFQALAGVAMGPLGERLDDSMRAMITDRCEVRLLEAGDVLMEQGKPVAGLHIVGAGKLELVQEGTVRGALVPGDLAFASGVLSHEPAPATLRAAAGGALVVVADRMTTHELLVSVPPLLELLATA